MSLGLLFGLLSALQVPTEQIDSYFEQEMKSSRVPGTSVAVVHNGALVFQKGYGLANVELAVKADETTVYELLSLSKQFTAAAVMMLIEDKRVKLDDQIVEQLDGLPASWKGVTIAHLLSHTSGIPDYTEQPGWFQTIRDARSPSDLLATVESKPVLFAAGTAWKYSNSNYYLLGLLIEKLGGKRFDDFVAARIFEPLGMHATRLESFDAIVPHRSAGYHLSKESVINSPWIDPSHKWAAGAFVSNVEDLAKWAIALDAKKLLQPATHELMLAPAVLADGTKAEYGIANELSLDHGHRVAGHQGGGMAFNTTFLRYVDDRLSVIVLCNLTQAPSRKWARHLASLWIPELAETPQPIADPDPAFSSVFKRVLIDAALGKVDAELFAADVREKMKAFVERTGPRFLGPMGELQSLTLLERKDAGAKRTLRYLAQFKKGPITWTLDLDSSGKIESMEPEQ